MRDLDDVKTPCESSNNAEAWTSDDAGERAWAARQCTGCPQLAACGLGALERTEMFGVWGGKDLTRNTKGILLQPAPEVCQRVGCTEPLTQKKCGPPRKFCSDNCATLSRLKPIAHGTEAGHRMHKRRNEPVCGPCREAHSLYGAERDRRRRRAA